MIEKGKTIALILLVGTSLLQSYFLAYGSADFEPILENEYIQTEKIGTQAAPAELLYPQQIILHGDNETHSILYPDHYFFRVILENIRKGSYEGLRLSNESADLLKKRNKQKGVEIRFFGGVPLNVFNMFLPIKDEFATVAQSDRISTMWLSVNELHSNINVYLANETETVVYEVVSTNLTAPKLEEFIGWGELQPKYTALQERLYIPMEDIPMKRMIYKYTSITSEQMETMLFSDPGITRILPTRDGTEIYTDGNLGLQIKRDQLWMSYTNPIAPLDGKSDIRDDLNTAVQFINQRGGWNGKFRIDHVAPDLTEKGQRLIFRQFIPSYPAAHPVVDHEESRFGYMSVTIQGGTVSEYERSLIMTDPVPDSNTEVLLTGGEQLHDRLMKYPNLYLATAVFPAYRPQIKAEYVEFVPIWAVELRNGIIEQLP